MLFVVLYNSVVQCSCHSCTEHQKNSLCMIYKHFENNVLINHLLLVIPVIIFKCFFNSIFFLLLSLDSYNKVAVAGTYFKYQFCLKRCDFLKEI